MSDDDRAISIPRFLRARLRQVSEHHRLEAPDALARRFVDRGLDHQGAPPGPRADRLRWMVDEHGYASEGEVLEHLLLRGLRAYEEPTRSPEELAARLRGLGYID